jgi:hypothetical protein
MLPLPFRYYAYISSVYKNAVNFAPLEMSNFGIFVVNFCGVFCGAGRMVGKLCYNIEEYKYNTPGASTQIRMGFIIGYVCRWRT